MSATVRVVAGLAWRRMWRARSIWITGALAVIALATALVEQALDQDAASRWETVLAFWLRFLVTLAAATHLAAAVGEEIEAKTFTYLWSRPVRRAEVLLGKMAAVIPALVAASVVVLAAAYLITTGAEAGEHLGWLGRGLAAAALGTIAAGAFAAGGGSLFPRHPFLFTMGYLLAAEQFLPSIPNLANISFLYHARMIAGLDQGEAAGTALAWLAGLTALWTAVGVWRVSTADYGAEDR